MNRIGAYVARHGMGILLHGMILGKNVSSGVAGSCYNQRYGYKSATGSGMCR
jgi:hypothetical protein